MLQHMITDTDRMNWLEAHQLPAEILGGAEDGATSNFWGLASKAPTLREAVDYYIITGEEPQRHVI